MVLRGIGIRLGIPTGGLHGVGPGLLLGAGVGGRHGAGAGVPHGVGPHPDGGGAGLEMSARITRVIQVRSVIRAVSPDPAPTADIVPLQGAILIIAVTVPQATTDPQGITVPDHHRATEATDRQTPALSSTTTIPTTTPIVAPAEIRQARALSGAGARQEAATAEALLALQVEVEEVDADVTDFLYFFNKFPV